MECCTYMCPGTSTWMIWFFCPPRLPSSSRFLINLYTRVHISRSYSVASYFPNSPKQQGYFCFPTLIQLPQVTESSPTSRGGCLCLLHAKGPADPDPSAFLLHLWFKRSLILFGGSSYITMMLSFYTFYLLFALSLEQSGSNCEPLAPSGLEVYLKSEFWFLFDAFYRPRGQHCKQEVTWLPNMGIWPPALWNFRYLYLIVSRTEIDANRVLLPVRQRTLKSFEIF